MSEEEEEAELRAGSPKFHQDRSHYGAALGAWFRRQQPAAEDVRISNIDIPVATGFSNETVFFDAAWREDGAAQEQRFVARIEPASGPLFPAQTPELTVSVDVQHRAMTAVSGVAPVPPLLGYEPDPAVLGQPFFVMGFVEGVIPSDQPRYSQAGFLVDEATPDQRRRMVSSGLGTMGRIHALDWRTSGLGWLDDGVSEPGTRRQIELYRRYALDALAGRAHPVLFEALAWLAAHDPLDERIGLSWGDSRLGNMIWRDYEPVAVVDWEACALSPTEADLGWWLMFDRMSFDDMDAPRMAGFPTREEMISIYEDAAGREVRDPHYWEVFATMRFCAIFIRLGDRVVAAGLVPPEHSPAVGNDVTAALATQLERGGWA